jgi:hypothetical protein
MNPPAEAGGFLYPIPQGTDFIRNKVEDFVWVLAGIHPQRQLWILFRFFPALCGAAPHPSDFGCHLPRKTEGFFYIPSYFLNNPKSFDFFPFVLS